jgi:hypothetical protein
MNETLHHRTPHCAHRTAAYPPVGDALDAIAKLVRAMIDAGQPVPAEALAWVEACERVKATYRKPEVKDA